MDNFYDIVNTHNNIPLNTFYPLTLDRTPEGLVSCLYLINRPMVGVKIEVSEKPIKIGNHGGLNFLSIAGSYKLGYLVETPQTNTIISPVSLFIGNRDAESKKIKNVEVLYSDVHIHLIRCKSTNSFMIVPMCNLDFPKVVPLALGLEEIEEV